MTHQAEQTAQAQFHHASETYKNAACKLQETMLEAGGLRKFLIDKKYHQEIVQLYGKLQELLKSHYFPECFACESLLEYRAWMTSGEGLFNSEFERLRVLLEMEIGRRGVCLIGDGESEDEFVVESGKLMYALQSGLQGLKELKGGEMVGPGIGKEEWGGGLIDIFAALEKIRRGSSRMLGSKSGSEMQMDGVSQDLKGLREEFQRFLVTLVIHFDFIILETIDNPTICQQVDPAKELRNGKPRVYMEQLVGSRENLGLSVVARLKAIQCCIDELSQSRFQDANLWILEG